MKRALVALAVGSLAILALVTPAAAATFTGLVSPTIFGGLADLNGSGTVTSADSWVDFYGDTDIISGGLDCDAWTSENDGTQGDGVIDADDDCTLVGYDGTANGVTITVSDGHFVEADGVLIANGHKLPTTFNAADPDNPSVTAADFAWQVLGGRVDTNGNSLVDDDDCSVDIVNGWDILGVNCGFNPPSPSAWNGLIDVDGDSQITAADDSASGFFGLAVVDGFVQAPVAPAPTVTSFTPTSGPVGTKVVITGTNLTGATVTIGGVAATCTVDSSTQVTCTVPAGATTGSVVVTTAGGSVTATGTFTVTGTGGPCTITGTDGADALSGTSGNDVICAKAGSDQVRAKAGNDEVRGNKGADLLRGGAGDDLLKGGKGADVIRGGDGFDTCIGGKGNDTLKGCEA